jgi:hypothetical protein
VPDYRFVVNLRSDTFAEPFRESIPTAAYLLAADHATPGMRDLASGVREQGLDLFADNGNFELVGKTESHFRDRAREVLQKVRRAEDGLGHRARRGDLPAPLRKEATDLAREVRRFARDLTGDGDRARDVQLQLGPSHLIGVEDISMACWLALDLEPNYLELDRGDFRRQNETVARNAEARLRDLPRRLARKYYPVASAVDYNTAFDAGRAFADAGLSRAAMGFGAYMADDQYTDHAYIGLRRLNLPEQMPQRYLRTALAATGFWAGYRSRAGQAPSGFHFLGLGAPIVMALVALAAWGSRDLTYDATSPIRDAGEGTLYLTRPTYLKVRTRRAAERLTSSPDERWKCPCPFCKRFARAHPFDYREGRRRWEATGRSTVEAADLRPGGTLYEAYPLLSEPGAGELRTDVNRARSGHNHWALVGITEELGDAATSRESLRDFVDWVVSVYEQKTNSSHFARSARFGFQLADSGPSWGED